MRTLFPALLSLAISSLVTADVLIKGEMIQNHPNAGPPIIMTQLAKEGKFRMDLDLPMPAGKSTTIIHRDTNSTYRIMHSNKSYMSATGEDFEKDSAMLAKRLAKNGLIPQERPKLRATGNKDRIADWEVEEYVAETPNSKITFWFAASLQRFVPLLALSGDPGGAVGMLAFPDPASFPGVSIRTILEQRMGGMTMVTTINILSIEERVIPDSEFDLPAGYKKTTYSPG